MLRSFLAVSSLLAACAAGAVFAQDNPLAKLAWQVGPATGAIGDKATIAIPEGYAFLNAEETKKFSELTHNIPSGKEYLIAPQDLSWFAIFEFNPTGYVKDDESIDADAVLESVKEGTARSNDERRKRGWSTMSIVGWQFAPQYDRELKLLEWALIGRSDDSGQQVVNYNTRVLGRSGVMNVVLVSAPGNLYQAVAAFKKLVGGYAYVSGERYADFKQGDRMAQFGLAALIAGGAAAVATKKGFWSVLVGFLAAAWKFIAAGVVALLVGIGGLFKKKK